MLNVNCKDSVTLSLRDTEELRLIAKLGLKV